MNGQYMALTDYISDEQKEKLNKFKASNLNEFKFRVKNFFDKYEDNLINKLITDIKNCNLESVFNSETWNFSYKILASDIKILDPINPDRSFKVVSVLFKECCKNLKVELKNFTLEAQEGEDLHFTLYIKNPLNMITEEEILSYT